MVDHPLSKMSNEVVDLEYESQKLSEDRYERQKRISWWDQELLKNSNILVVGAGTLGNEVCKNLALLGVGNVTVIDYDIVEEVNLSRCVLMRSEDNGQNKADVVAKRMKELNREINVTPLNVAYNRTFLGIALLWMVGTIIGFQTSQKFRNMAINRYSIRHVLRMFGDMFRISDLLELENLRSSCH